MREGNGQGQHVGWGLAELRPRLKPCPAQICGLGPEPHFCSWPTGRSTGPGAESQSEGYASATERRGSGTAQPPGTDNTSSESGRGAPLSFPTGLRAVTPPRPSQNPFFPDPSLSVEEQPRKPRFFRQHLQPSATKSGLQPLGAGHCPLSNRGWGELWHLGASMSLTV